MKHKLTQLQAFNAVSKLLDIYYEQTGSGNLGGMLGGMSFVSDKSTADDGMLIGWDESVDAVLQGEGLNDHDNLTELQAFKAIPLFLEDFFGVDLFEDIMAFAQEMRLVVINDDKKSILWKNWIGCVEEVLSVDDARDYLILFKK